jgi:VIT1/CCC1 family predicted Fe2+/Mn2+ transporter
MVTGVAGLVAGAMSMAAGEHVSVHSQADTEKADLRLERTELKTNNEGEHQELAAIYVARGLDAAVAKQVARQLMAHDALGAHARDEPGISTAFGASDSGGVDFGHQPRRRRGPASRGHSHSPRGCAVLTCTNCRDLCRFCTSRQ